MVKFCPVIELETLVFRVATSQSYRQLFDLQFYTAMYTEHIVYCILDQIDSLSCLLNATVLKISFAKGAVV